MVAYIYLYSQDSEIHVGHIKHSAFDYVSWMLRPVVLALCNIKIKSPYTYVIWRYVSAVHTSRIGDGVK